MTASHRVEHGSEADRPIGELLSELSSELQELLRKELELAKLEVRDQARRAGQAGAMLGGTVVGALLGALLLSFAAAWGLAEAIPTGLAFLAVGLVYVIVAGVLFAQARKRLSELRPVPEQTLRTLKEDMEVAKGSLARGTQTESPGYARPWATERRA